MNSLSDEIIIARILDGRHDDFANLVNRYENEVKQIVCSFIRNQHDQQDVVQEVWVSAFQNLSSLSDHKRFLQWLKVITRNRCLSYFRQTKGSLEKLVDLEPRDIFVDVHKRTTRNRSVRAAVSMLSQVLRNTVAHYYFTGYSCAEVSVKMDVPVGTVKRRLAEARSKIRKILDARWSQMPESGSFYLKNLVSCLKNFVPS